MDRQIPTEDVKLMESFISLIRLQPNAIYLARTEYEGKPVTCICYREGREVSPIAVLSTGLIGEFKNPFDDDKRRV